jgi:riboflavin biosynthesis pyrimidine reductase
MKPYIICFMLSSVDGRIKQNNWPLKNPGRIYEEHAAEIETDGWIVGRITMEEFSSKKPRRKRPGKFDVPKGDFIGKYNTRTFAIAIDPHGKLAWDSNMVDTEHVISVLTEEVSAEYLDYLRSRNVSYIFGGKTSLDLKKALNKLAAKFPIKRLTLQGGGGVNGSFLKAGLIDELRLLVCPVADGATGVPTVFDAEAGYTKRKAARLKLRSAKIVNQDFVMLQYTLSK